MRAKLASAAACALLAALVMVTTGCASHTPRANVPTPTQAARALATAPPPLAALHRQAGELLGGGTTAFAARLAQLRGRPVVVNKWASWCDPCRFELPFFQRTSVRFGTRVAFVGLDGGDETKRARSFLRRRWLSYPSYEDPHEQIARAIHAPNNYPITLFYDRHGRVAYVHQGQYRDEAQLVADIERYALRS
jgi:cytochrome c biogenesis protein CcmG/thiol:disulfide interchange protein DsbE